MPNVAQNRPVTHNPRSFKGSVYHPMQSPEMRLREVSPGVTLDAIAPKIAHNGRDEIVFETDDKKLYVLDAVRLSSMEPPRVGDRIALGDLADGLHGKIVHLDLENPRDALALSTIITGVLAAAILGGPGGFLLGAIAVPLGFVVGAPVHDDTRLDSTTDTIARSPIGSLSAITLMIKLKAEAARSA